MISNIYDIFKIARSDIGTIEVSYSALDCYVRAFTGVELKTDQLYHLKTALDGSGLEIFSKVGFQRLVVERLGYMELTSNQKKELRR